MGSLPFLWVINDNFKSFVKTFGFIARLAILYYILDLKMFCSHNRNNTYIACTGWSRGREEAQMVQGSRLGGRLLQVCHLFHRLFHYHYLQTSFSSSSSRFKGVDLGFLLWVLSPTSKELFAITESTPPSLMA